MVLLLLCCCWLNRAPCVWRPLPLCPIKLLPLSLERYGLYDDYYTLLYHTLSYFFFFLFRPKCWWFFFFFLSFFLSFCFVCCNHIWNGDDIPPTTFSPKWNKTGLHSLFRAAVIFSVCYDILQPLWSFFFLSLSDFSRFFPFFVSLTPSIIHYSSPKRNVDDMILTL